MKLAADIAGIGAWGPGFNNWEELVTLLKNPSDEPLPEAVAPKPTVIPANERRRAPLPVKMAVETSSQACTHARISPQEAACVFGSGLGDTEITDYMCRVLTTELKQLSPTKFHNSVHNAAAGYWTISSDCMKAANSVAAYHFTAGISLLEALAHVATHEEPVLMTLFDTKAHKVYGEIFDCSHDFAASLLLVPSNPENVKQPSLTATLNCGRGELPTPSNQVLAGLYTENPSAKLLTLLELLSHEMGGETRLAVSDGTSLDIVLS